MQNKIYWAILHKTIVLYLLIKKYLLTKVQVTIITCISIFNLSPSLIRVAAISEPFFENEIKIVVILDSLRKIELSRK